MERSLRGRIAVTGANGQVGRALLDRLRMENVRTVALTREPAALPAYEVIPGPLDSYEALFALRRADYVVHLAGTLSPRGKNSYWSANGRTVDALALALTPSSCRRVLFLSYVGASEESRNLYLRLKARAERLIAETGKDFVVFRCTHIIGSPEAPGPTARGLQARSGRAAVVLGSGRQWIAPVFVGDVASALVSAMTRGDKGIYDLTGPDRMTMDELVRLVNCNPDVAIHHLPGTLARLFGRVLPSLPAPLVDLMIRDSLGDGSRAIQAFGLRPTSLPDVWKDAKSSRPRKSSDGRLQLPTAAGARQPKKPSLPAALD